MKSIKKLICPYCEKLTESKVINSRSGGSRIWRQRRCLSCKKTFITKEGIKVIENA